MPSPALDAASKSTRSEATARTLWCERFIQKQLAGLRTLGLDENALAREEKLLRSGMTAPQLAGLMGSPPDVV